MILQTKNNSQQEVPMAEYTSLLREKSWGVLEGTPRREILNDAKNTGLPVR